jgi:PadR family transcriptional regulator PadR
LLILCNGRSHGYELRRTLQQFDLPRAQKDPPALYRLLRDLEAAGLIVSSWEPGGAGPARRYYELTLAGREQLDRSATHLARQMHRLQLFFETYRHAAEA